MMLKDKRLDIGIIISIVIHLVLLFILSRSGSAATGSFEDINEVTFLDQSYRPEVAKVVSKGSVWSEVPETQAPSGTYGSTEIVTPAIDLNVKLDRSQAKIDLERYASQDGSGEVIKIGDRSNGTMKSTEEILAEKPISLAKNLPKGAGAEGGVGIGNPGGIGKKGQTPTIKIDKKPPPSTPTSQIGKQVETKIEEKLKVDAGGTQISLAGPIAGRDITKKLLPKYPAWCLSKGISGVVKIRIEVNPGGNVRENVRVEISSGYPDLDQAVVNAIKAWMFAPLPSNVVQEVQWGIITFRFVCG
jgi:TonB family protein